MVVLIAGLGGSGSYWLPQLAVLGQEYQVVCYDQRGTGITRIPCRKTTPLTHGRRACAGFSRGRDRPLLRGRPRAGALVGLRLAIDKPDALTALVCVNGWLTLNAHTRRCFDVRERLLHAGGAQAWVEAQPLFLYPADWMAARAPRLEAEDALALAHFQGKANLLRRLHALKQADFSRHAARVRCHVQIICSTDDLLVPSVCSDELHAALPHARKTVMRRRACLQRDRAGHL